MRRHTRAASVAAAAALLLAACADDAPDEEASGDPSETGSSSPSAEATQSTEPTPSAEPGADLGAALSKPREDSYYPDVGDPGVDALHYDLSLTWDPDARRLDAVEVVTLRATKAAKQLRLDFGEPLEVEGLTVDGEPADFEEEGKDLVVAHPVRADQRYILELTYGGTPEPVPVPVQRTDFSTTGWTITPQGETWTMQEPFGAYSWYAVNDHPADEALYDFTLSVPAPWTGVANGELVETRERDGNTVTTWHLAEPAASYVVTAAFGDFTMTRDESPSGVPITYWTPRSAPRTLQALRVTPEAIAWVEDLLGPYPFDTFGTVVVDSESGMETQTMVTLGDTDYTLSAPVIVHEIAHQWYGNQVTPNDWRDVWMNEGLVMYLQFMWEAEQEGISIDAKMDQWRGYEATARAEAGPPAAYFPGSFGSGNVYYGPAMMFHELRKKVGDQRFFPMIRGWPAAGDNANLGREQFLAYMEKSTGEELTAFFDAWLLGRTTPPHS